MQVFRISQGYFYHSDSPVPVGREHSIECLLDEWMSPLSLHFIMFFSDIETQYTVKHIYTQDEQEFKEIFLTAIVSWYYFNPNISFFLFFANSLKHTGHDQPS